MIEPPRFLSLDAADVVAVTAPDGAQLPLYSLAGPLDAPGLLMAHANGFAAGSYAPWLRMLARTMRVFAYDARGHGGAAWPAGPLDAVFHVDRFADELFEDLDAPVRRVAATDTFVAYQPLLENVILPQASDLYKAMESLAKF